MSFAKLTELIKQAAMQAVANAQMSTVLFGRVTSIKPLIIETDNQLVLTHEFLVVSRDLTDYQKVISFENETTKQKIKIYDKPEDEPFEKPSDPETILREITDIQFVWTDYKPGDNNDDERGGSQPTRHTINVYNHLEVGERVIMVKETGGQRYFVLDREGIMMDGGERCDTDQRSFY